MRFGTCGGIGGLTQAQRVQQLLEALAVFGRVDHVRAGTDDGHAIGFQIQRQLQGRLTAILHNHARGFFFFHNFQHVFQSDGFEIQAVRRIVIGGHGFGVAVHHNGFITIFPHGQSRVYTAVVKFNALTNTVRPATQDHDFLARGGLCLTLRAFALVGGIHIRGIGGELGRAGIDTLVHRSHAQRMAAHTHLGRRGTQLACQTTV